LVPGAKKTDMIKDKPSSLFVVVRLQKRPYVAIN
jgi:hypothetical protein